VNKNEKLDELCYNGYEFDSIVKLANGQITFDKKTKNIVYSDKKFSLFANLKFLSGFYNNFRKTECEKYYKPNNYFNIGKIIRRKSDEKMIYDYPHYYQMKIENDPELPFYAIRPGENSSFILSKSIVREFL
jgi:dTDP-4-dehydrorhamnose 3,5-epimerase-like enzyme